MNGIVYSKLLKFFVSSSSSSFLEGCFFYFNLSSSPLSILGLNLIGRTNVLFCHHNWDCGTNWFEINLLMVKIN